MPRKPRVRKAAAALAGEGLAMTMSAAAGGCTVRAMAGGWVRPGDLPRGPNGHALCRFCGVETRPPRKTFCSAECVHEWKMRSRPSYLKAVVYRRDHGVCGSCGTDTRAFAQALLARILHSPRRRSEIMREWGVPASRSIKLRGPQSGLWDLEHTVPVADGGGLADASQCTTMCIPCHKQKTKREAGERAAARRVLGRAAREKGARNVKRITST